MEAKLRLIWFYILINKIYYVKIAMWINIDNVNNSTIQKE